MDRNALFQQGMGCFPHNFLISSCSVLFGGVKPFQDVQVAGSVYNVCAVNGAHPAGRACHADWGRKGQGFWHSGIETIFLGRITNWDKLRVDQKKHSQSSWSLIMSEIWWNQNNKHAACRMRWKWRKVPEVWFPETIPNPWWPTDSCDRRGYACNTYALGKAMSSSWNYSPFHTNSIPPVSGDILGSPHYPVVVFWKKRCFPASFC